MENILFHSMIFSKKERKHKHSSDYKIQLLECPTCGYAFVYSEEDQMWIPQTPETS
jgi:hypothetical protein